MEGWRNEHEDVLLERFAEVLQPGTKVTVLADRGFGDQALYELLKDQLGFDFVVRFRGIVKVMSADGETKPAKEWVPTRGRPLLLRKARVTKARREVGGVVCVKAKGMKEPWCLATSHEEKTGAEIVKLYGRRFTIEDSFRDLKNLRFGMGLSDTRIGTPERRDRILLVGAIAAALLTLLGAAGEAVGEDRRMKANTSKERTHSLLNQGLFYFDCLPGMRDERARPLMQKFDELLRQHACRSPEPVRAGTIDDSARGLDSRRLDASPPRGPTGHRGDHLASAAAAPHPARSGGRLQRPPP
jgi:hypothetical protein